MKVFIVGITGETGSRAAQLLKDRGDEVGGLYRRPEQGEELKKAGFKGAEGDITRIEPAELAEHLRGSDALIFSAGASGGGDEMTDRIDAEGVFKSIEAADLAGVKRLLLVSVFPEAWRERDMDEGFEHYMVAKKRADVALTQSDLDYVILRPSALKNDAGQGKVSLGPAQFHMEVRRDDVAAVLAELVHTPAVRRQILELTEGSTPIAEAVQAQAGR